ncbi:MAG: hypothetical protein CME64_15800 [Halobacteriovoraceae bacterium]|nr:hypothetical protein [Halobacteriovoraceae bacterium]|tara:strand:+ start:7877 stop:9169 length:1293 start_codon:yes stop_codon:yes gene_type:complete
MLKLFIALLFSVAAYSGVVQEQLFVTDSSFLKLASERVELTIDHVSQDGFELYGPKGTKKWLEQIGVDHRVIEHTHHHNKSRSKYPTYEEITSSLKALAKLYPHIMSLESIGKSVEGRELWMVKISDNVKKDETEPEFKYISSMHGNEITGRELTQFFIKDLLEGYGNNSRITWLIDNTELFIMPSMNPDGSKRKRRGNANWVDLNRNFPDWTKGEANTWNKRQPETVAVMKLHRKRQFALSANFHGGAVVVNYPWDSTYDRHPVDALVKELSLRYSKENYPMYTSNRFEDGVTNGADWYKLHGGMQDWSYFWHNDLQVTVELSAKKWPHYSSIPSFYKDNKESMLVFAESIHQGAGFKLKDSAEGKVKITKLSPDTKSLGSFGFSSGEFYKVLEPGKYRFDVSAGGEKHSFETQVEFELNKENGNYTKL